MLSGSSLKKLKQSLLKFFRDRAVKSFQPGWGRCVAMDTSPTSCLCDQAPTVIPQNRPFPVYSTPYTSIRVLTQKTPQNARFAKTGIFGKTRKTPGFHRSEYLGEIFKRGSFRLFQNRSSFPRLEAGWTEWRGSIKDARQNALGGSGGHYMRLDSGLFLKMG
jgi:hypothetical protein